MRSDDQFYIDYHNRLLELVKEAIAKGTYSKLNSSIQNTWECKQWMNKAGHLFAKTDLTNGWLHPLAEFSTVNGRKKNEFLGFCLANGCGCDRTILRLWRQRYVHKTLDSARRIGRKNRL